MSNEIKPNFKKRTMIYDSKEKKDERRNFIIVIIVDYKTKEVLMQAFMNEEAWQKTQESGLVYFWSFSRNELWLKGKTSGNKLEVKKIIADCDRDCVKIDVKVQGNGVACHTGSRTCFFNPIELERN